MEQLSLSALLVLFLLAACGGGGGGGDDGPPAPVDPDPLELLSVNPPAGTVLAWNQALTFRFSEAVDPGSVSSDAVRILAADGGVAIGTFSLEDSGRRLVFRPRCPLEPDGSDAGLTPESDYTVELVGGVSAGVPALTNSEGEGLETTAVIPYSTAAFNGGPVLEDPVVGPPAIVVRPLGSSDSEGSRILSAGEARYFEFDAGTASVPVIDELPRQLRSDPAGRFSVHVVFDQPISSSEQNLSLVVLERRDELGAWQAVPARRELIDNGCAGGGARIRLESERLLPALAELRVAVLAGLVDVSGDATTSDDLSTLLLRTAQAPSPGFAGFDVYGDELFEDFQSASWLENPTTHGDPVAAWGAGELAPSASFEGTGGPGGTFDWRIADGEDFVLDTETGVVLGGPGFLPLTSQSIAAGRLDVRDLWIEEGGALFVVGPHPLRIFATGSVQLDGRIVLNGGDAPEVIALQGGSIVAPGGVGGPGAGDGGAGSPNTTMSSALGIAGGSPFDRSSGGGGGGETGYGSGLPRDFLGAGGGGGRFARNQGAESARPGQNGGTFSTSAVTGLAPAGGASGSPVFVDSDPTNDFWGRRWIGSLGVFVQGELEDLSAGAGGGGGGDSIPIGAFPGDLVSDRIGGGGGGGGGGLLLVVAGDLVFGTSGQIHADGGQGAAGELFSGAYPVAGGGGGGSGGHIVLKVGGTFDGRFLAAEGITAIGGKVSASTNTSVAANSSGGGSGGPGVIQIHVRNQLTHLLLPVPAVSLASRTTPTAEVLSLDFGPQSRARSRWIHVGGEDTEFAFAGLDLAGNPSDSDTDGSVDLGRPFLGPIPVSETALPRFDASDVVLFDGAPLVATRDEVVLGNPRLLAGALLTVEVDGQPAERHAIATASLEGGTLRVLLESPRVGVLPANARLALRPRDFAFQGQPDLAAMGVTIRLQGAGATAAGEPDLFDATPWSADASALAGSRFLRFEVGFDLTTGEAPPLDYLRIPIRFR